MHGFDSGRRRAGSGIAAGRRAIARASLALVAGTLAAPLAAHPIAGGRPVGAGFAHAFGHHLWLPLALGALAGLGVALAVLARRRTSGGAEAGGTVVDPARRSAEASAASTVPAAAPRQRTTNAD